MVEYHEGSGPDELQNLALTAMKKPVVLYQMTIRPSEARVGRWMFWFVFVDGHFRYLDRMLALHKE